MTLTNHAGYSYGKTFLSECSFVARIESTSNAAASASSPYQPLRATAIAPTSRELDKDRLLARALGARAEIIVLRDKDLPDLGGGDGPAGFLERKSHRQVCAVASRR
jgi:hypothetical protein